MGGQINLKCRSNIGPRYVLILALRHCLFTYATDMARICDIVKEF